MAIDDKEIAGEGYTIILNRDTKKIFLMISTRKFKIIKKVLSHIPLSRFLKVKTITKDLASNYDWLARTVFPQAVRIADKFHVLKLGFEAMQDVRVRFRQEVLTAEKEKKKSSKNKKKKKEKKIPEKYKNGDNKKELLARSRYLLFKREDQWIETQSERANILFKEFPEIKESYKLMEEFRDFYALKTGGKREKNNAERALNIWYRNVKNSNIREMMNFSKTVKRHQPEIMAYFYTNATNAISESINAKIQRFLISSFGIQNRNFISFQLIISHYWLLLQFHHHQKFFLQLFVEIVHRVIHFEWFSPKVLLQILGHILFLLKNLYSID